MPLIRFLPVLLASACNVGDAPEPTEPEPVRTGRAVTDAASAPADGAAVAQTPAQPVPAERSGVDADAPPAAGSAQRAAIMEALRPTIERKLGGPVEFLVRRAGVEDGWALVVADPRRPGGGRINPKRHFPNEVIEFMDGLTVYAILRFGEGDGGGGWRLVDHAIGPTDAWRCGVEGPPRSLTGC